MQLVVVRSENVLLTGVRAERHHPRAPRRDHPKENDRAGVCSPVEFFPRNYMVRCLQFYTVAVKPSTLLLPATRCVSVPPDSSRPRRRRPPPPRHRRRHRRLSLLVRFLLRLLLITHSSSSPPPPCPPSSHSTARRQSAVLTRHEMRAALPPSAANTSWTAAVHTPMAARSSPRLTRDQRASPISP